VTNPSQSRQSRPAIITTEDNSPATNKPSAMTNPSLIRLACLLMSGLACQPAFAADALAVPASAPPNVIIVISDDQGYGDLSCHGNPVLRTPALDRLHSQSARLTDFHVAPSCSPTRAALMSGH